MKKVFISADIEGTAFAATWDSTHIGGHDYERNRQEMTNEVLAAAEGAHAAGAELVVVKDAHGPGINIYPEQMPEYVQLIRGWTFEPRCMVEGIDKSFDAAMYVGYHNAAGQEGNVLSHTIAGGAVQEIRVNGQIALRVFDLQLHGGLLRRAERPADRGQDPLRAEPAAAPQAADGGGEGRLWRAQSGA